MFKISYNNNLIIGIQICLTLKLGIKRNVYIYVVIFWFWLVTYIKNKIMPIFWEIVIHRDEFVGRMVSLCIVHKTKGWTDCVGGGLEGVAAVICHSTAATVTVLSLLFRHCDTVLRCQVSCWDYFREEQNIVLQQVITECRTLSLFKNCMYCRFYVYQHCYIYETLKGNRFITLGRLKRETCYCMLLYRGRL